MTSDSKYDPVLINTSRLTPPNLSANSVCRERLLRKVWNTNRIAARICILSAPAGYGKSTFLVQCEQKLRKMDVNTAWLTLETGEGDREFFCYLGAAFSQLIPKISDKIIDFFTEKTSQFNYKGIISSLIYSASGNSSQKYALFLDDYHKAEAIQVHEAIKFLINNLPDNFYIFIASRERLPINLSRQRLSGDLLLIDCENLSFDYEEAKTLLKEKNNLSVKSDEVVSLQEKTRGWAAALQLASLSLHNATDRRKFFNSFSGNDDSIYEFISSEIMSSLTDDQADFLIKISILNRFCPPPLPGNYKKPEIQFPFNRFLRISFFCH